jgi:dipeptidyl aminopeptidase/acylaminoacyl peptidase
MNTLVRIALALAILGVVVPPAQATFPGRNGAIAFAQNTGSGEPEGPPFVGHARLATSFPQSPNQRILVDCELTDDVPTGGDCRVRHFSSPSYSADGSRLVFDAFERIGAIGADGSGLTLLPGVTADDGDPAFAPGGRRIVFTGSNDRGTRDVYVRSVGGGPARLIIRDAGEPAWSSRDEIAYVRSGNVYVARPDGSHRRWVTSGVSPDWSPDGRRLLIIRPLPTLVFDAPLGYMYVVGARGRGLRRVSREGSASDPVWSPDGRSFAYDAADRGVLAKRFGAGGPGRSVARSDVGDSGYVASFDPAWRPRPR